MWQWLLLISRRTKDVQTVPNGGQLMFVKASVDLSGRLWLVWRGAATPSGLFKGRWAAGELVKPANCCLMKNHVMITYDNNMIMFLKVGQVPSRPWFPDLRLPILRGSPSWARKPRTVWLLRCCSRCCSRCCFPKSNFPQIPAKFCSWWNLHHQRSPETQVWTQN